MMARFGRRRSEPTGDDDVDDEQWPDEEPALRRGAQADTPEDDLPSNRLRGNELTYGYMVGAVLMVSGILMLVITTGKGAPTHHQPIWAALGIVFGLATILSIRFTHRLLTGFIAIAGGFISEQAKTPNSLSGVKLVALVVPFFYFFVLFRRISKADRAARAQRPRQSAAERRAARSKGKSNEKDGPIPGRPAPSGRYTPPSKKERRSRTR